MRFRLVSTVALLFVAFPAPRTAAQSRRSSSRPANVQSGAVEAIDPAAATLTLKPKSGPAVSFRLTDKTRILRDKKPAELSVFHPSDAVVVRFRRSSVGPAALYDLADKASWEWLDRIRHETTLVTVKEITENALRAVEGKDSAEVEYRITDRTAWSRAGRPAGAEDFHIGEQAHVVPRLLPGGGLMAIAVSDAAGSAAVLKERTRFTITGLVKGIDSEKRSLVLHTAAGDDRDLSIVPDCVVRMASRDVPLTAVKAGQTVTVRLARAAEGEQVVSRITIQTRKSAATRSRAGAKPAARPGAARPLPAPAAKPPPVAGPS